MWGGGSGSGGGGGGGDVVGWGTKEKGKKGFAPLFKVHQLVSLRCLSHYFEPSPLSLSPPSLSPPSLSLHPPSLSTPLYLSTPSPSSSLSLSSPLSFSTPLPPCSLPPPLGHAYNVVVVSCWLFTSRSPPTVTSGQTNTVRVTKRTNKHCQSYKTHKQTLSELQNAQTSTVRVTKRTNKHCQSYKTHKRKLYLGERKI